MAAQSFISTIQRAIHRCKWAVYGFQYETYSYIGGHNAVRNEVVEDMALARLVKRNNHSLGMFHGKNTVYCRMYHTSKEVWDGFGKNFILSFPNMFTFISMGLLHLLVFIFPVTVPFIIYANGSSTLSYTMYSLVLALLSVCLFTVQRLSLDWLFNWRASYSFLHIFSVIWFQALAIRLIWNKLSGRKVKWKGRPI